MDEIYIENKSDNLELEKALIQFIEEEMNGLLIGRNLWKCWLGDGFWTLDTMKEELASMVDTDPRGIILWVRRKPRFWLKGDWMQIALRSGMEIVSWEKAPKVEKRLHLV